MAVKQDVGAEKNIAASEARAPLIDVESAESPGANKESAWMVWVSSLVAVCGSFEFGACMGYSAPTQAAIRSSMHLSISQFAVFGSIVTIGAMIGAVTSGYITEFSGRKGAMRMSAVVCIVGWLAIYFAADAIPLDIGRFLTGYGIGVFSYVVPVYIAEIAPTNLRGGLTTLNQLLICTGVSVVYILGAFLTWRTLILAGIVPCVILLMGSFFIPESPRWLMKSGRQKEFEVALQVLRGKDADISNEAGQIQDYIKNLECQPKARMHDLFQRRYIRSVIISVGLMAFQQFGGINGVVFYVSEIFVSAGFSSGDVGTIILGCLQVPITALGAVLMDKSGRRQLYAISASGTSLGTFLAAIAFYLKGHGLLPGVYPILALTGILVYIGSFSLGMGAVPWVIMSEIFPSNIKGTAGSLVNLTHWFGSWVTSYSFNFLVTWSASGTFFIFFAINFGAILFVLKMVPETKGRTLEEIQASINAS